MGRDSRVNPNTPIPFAAKNIPIVGQTPPSEVKDIYGRTLQEGDLVHLQTPTAQPFFVNSIQPMEGQPALMDVVLTCTVRFAAPKGQVNQEFIRVLRADERAAKQANSKDGISISNVEEPAVVGHPDGFSAEEGTPV